MAVRKHHVGIGIVTSVATAGTPESVHGCRAPFQIGLPVKYDFVPAAEPVACQEGSAGIHDLIHLNCGRGGSPCPGAEGAPNSTHGIAPTQSEAIGIVTIIGESHLDGQFHRSLGRRALPRLGAYQEGARPGRQLRLSQIGNR